MTKQEFTEKLTPFFSPSQIEKLDNAALEAAQDIGETHDAGRDFIAVLIYDTAENPDEMKQALDIDMTDEARNALVTQFSIEW